MKQTEGKRNTRTKQAIHDAFVEMICENKSNEINIKNLTERAGIHRKTFYLHYTCIEALYEDELSLLANGYFEEVEKLPLPFSYYDLTRVLFEYNSRSQYSELLYCNPTYSDFSMKLIATTMKHNRQINNPYEAYSPEMQNIINAFVTNASMVAYRQWVADGKKVPVEEVVQVVGSLLETGVQSIVRS